MRIGVLGGTFDPPHNGHLALARAARDELALDRVIWVPAGDPWRKTGTAISPGEDRLAMVKLAIDAERGLEVDASEVQREGPSYTSETLAALRERWPDAELYFILGGDALADLPSWHEPARIMEPAMLGATAREGVRPDDETLDGWLPGLSQRVVWFEMPRIDISATELRRRAAAGESLAGAVPPAVEQYIRSHNLYKRR